MLNGIMHLLIWMKVFNENLNKKQEAQEKNIEEMLVQ